MENSVRSSYHRLHVYANVLAPDLVGRRGITDNPGNSSGSEAGFEETWLPDKLTCQKKCGALVRQRRKRALAKEREYELRRELRISMKNDRQRRLKTGASR